MYDDGQPPPSRVTNWTLPKEETLQAKRAARPPRPMNRVDDIDGARAPVPRGERFASRDANLAVGDIPGATSRRIIPATVTRPNRALETRDILDNGPEQKVFETRRVVNPLAPDYRLPQVAQPPPAVLRFCRDTLVVSDIPGTRSRRAGAGRGASAVRDVMVHRDIEKSWAGSATAKHRRHDGDNMRTADINGRKAHLRGSRFTSPLDPVYKIDPPAVGAPEYALQLSDVDGAKPRLQPAARTALPSASLLTADISGAAPGTNVPYPKQRRGWKTTCDVSDVDTRGKRNLRDL